MAVLPTWRFAEEKNSYPHNERPDEANSHWKSPRASAVVLLGAEVYAVCGEDSEGDEELVAGYESAANVAGSGLGLIHRCQDGKTTDSQSCYPASNRDLIPFRCCYDLNDHSDAEDDVPEGNRVFATELVCDGCCSESSDESSY